MDANALQMMVIPIVAGLCLGTALGVVGLAVMRTIDAIAGLGHARAPRRARIGASGRGR